MLHDAGQSLSNAALAGCITNTRLKVLSWDVKTPRICGFVSLRPALTGVIKTLRQCNNQILILKKLPGGYLIEQL